MNSGVLRNTPVVCACEENYIIYVAVKKKVLMSVTVGDKVYYNHCGGVKISETSLQSFCVPMKELDKYKQYTVSYEVLIKRLPYFSLKQKPVNVCFCFTPVNANRQISIYHISDTHGIFENAVKASGFFGRTPDILILNGDISSSSNSIEELLLTFDIASGVTKGSVPCIITRGNHDLRGKYSEKLISYAPNVNGKFYYTVTLGSIWFLVLDCGEDKYDSHVEYSGTVCFHNLRQEEAEYIDEICCSPNKRFNSSNIKYRFVVSHIPFCYANNEESRGEKPFNIESEIYSHWCKTINENIKPHLLISGHMHTLNLYEPNSDFDTYNIGCSVLVGGKPRTGNGLGYTGAALLLSSDDLTVSFTDENSKIISEHTVSL